MNAGNVKVLHFVVLFLLYLFSAIPATARYPDLAGYWDFNNNTLDFSGNDSTGTVYGSASWAAGKTGKAFFFDGNTSINCGWDSSLSIADNISIELWFYPEQWITGYAAHPINKWTGTGDANYVMYFFGDTAGGMYKKVGFYANAGGTWKGVSPTYLIPALNTWYHVVWTYNSTSGGCLYVNGVSQGSSTGIGVLAANSASLNIGKYGVNPGFNGMLDEVKIYDRALASAEIQQKYLDAQTRGNWNFNYNTHDFSGNDNTGTISGSANWAAGKVGKAFSFNGSTSINCGNDSSLSINDNISIELWFNPQAWVSGSATHIINKWTSTTDANYVMYFFGDTGGNNYKKIGFIANAGGAWQAVSPYYLIPSLNTWYHIVWTYNSASGGRLYVNGVSQGSSTGNGVLAANSASLNIGKYGVNPGFNGMLDEVKIYNRVLNQSEVTAAYQNLGTPGATLESSNLKLTINSTGQITEFKDKLNGNNYSGGTIDLIALIDTNTHSPVSCLQKDGKLLIDFGSTYKVGVEITTRLKDSYFVFQISSAYGNTANFQELRLLYLNPPLNTYVSDMSGIRGNDTYTVALRAMNARSDVTAGNVFPGRANFQIGLELAKFGLLGSSTVNLRPALQAMVTNERLARTSQGGPWALDVAANSQSYIIVYNLSPSNVNSYITLANEAGSKIIDCEYWWNSTGHYVLNTDLKTCVTAIHAAGLKASLHTLTCTISTNDSYVTPSADTRLQKDAQFTLASINGTTISATSQLSTGGLNTTGQVLQIDNELITYAGYTITGSAPPYTYTFSGCTRGAYSTTVQTHATGASVGHLRGYGNCFFPDPNSNLVNEIADRIAYIFNDCNFDMIYLDAADFSGSTYAGVKWGTAIINRIGKPIRIETSVPAHHYWTFYSNLGALDTPHYGLKTFIDRHAESVSNYSKTHLLPSQLGWWNFRGGPSCNIYAQFPDEVELLCARSLGYDAALSFIIPTITEVARQDEYFQMVHGYETLRSAGSVPESVKSQLKTPGLEFHLTPANSIIKRDIPKHKITGLSDGSSTWTVNNQFASQSAKFRILALHSELTAAYDSGPSVLVTDFSGLPGEYTLTQAANVTSSMTYVPGTGCTYTATNNGSSSSGAWTKASKSFSPALDISGGGYYNDTIGVWVNGDGKGEILNFQYCQPEYDDHYVTVDFTGWKYFELFLRERDADNYYKYIWSYGYPGCYPLHYYVVPRTNIPNFNIYYNNIPPGQTVSCQIKPVKALFTESFSITNPSILINATQITFPVILRSGEYLEFNSMSDCKHYDGHGTFLGDVIPTGSVPTLNAGNNSVIFNGSGTSGYNTRATVTMFIDGPQIYP